MTWFVAVLTYVGAVREFITTFLARECVRAREEKGRRNREGLHR